MQEVKSFVAALFGALFCFGPAIAQHYDDSNICRGLPRTGLYFVSTATAGQTEVTPIDGRAVRYDPTGRFYLVTGTSAAEEDVWHIRSQTKALAAPRAGSAYVYRPAVQTRCSGPTALREFAPDDRFVELNSYIDYHSEQSNRREPNPGLRDLFHFEVSDPDTGRCVRTDHRMGGRKLADVYGFADVERSDQMTAFEQTTSVTTRALALSRRFEGLTSEFAYRDGPGLRCVSFSAPIPTGPVARGWGFFSSRYSASLEAAREWQPRTTAITIRRIRGSRAMEAVNRTIAWTP